ncbi:MAG: hypothetical protein OXF88_01510 [Rhodobacteraceae bacterium]|nr:hypothetical protein [Paracoccaceae bacterium]MCY4141604.1 hypothetical protein [Paracoccaceae bacterium]
MAGPATGFTPHAATGYNTAVAVFTGVSRPTGRHKSRGIDNHARQQLRAARDKPGEQRYSRFDIRLENALDDLDATHRANIAALPLEMDKIIEGQGGELDRLTEMLVRRADG